MTPLREEQQQAERQYCLLPHLELNPEAAKPVLLVHGPFGSSSSWHSAVAHLKAYHLLVPDLPCHGTARHHGPFSRARAARLLAALIAHRAHGGVAKVVGHSLGAGVALRLISEHSHVVDGAAFLSGCGTPPSSPSAGPSILPYAALTSQRVESVIPRTVVRWLMDGVDIPPPDLSICPLSLNEAVFASSDMKWPAPWPARTLIIAAGKGGLIPSQDNAHTARRLAEIGRAGNEATLAVTHPAMRHAWNMQSPAVFAESIEAWFERGAALEGFVKLSFNEIPPQKRRLPRASFCSCIRRARDAAAYGD